MLALFGTTFEHAASTSGELSVSQNFASFATAARVAATHALAASTSTLDDMPRPRKLLQLLVSPE